VAPPRRILRVVNRPLTCLFGARLRRRSPRVYYVLALLLITAPAGADDLRLTVDPLMTKGAPGAPVTIVEFSDYQ